MPKQKKDKAAPYGRRKDGKPKYPNSKPYTQKVLKTVAINIVPESSDSKPKKKKKLSPEHRAKALKNIQGHMWQPGQSGNPSGRAKGTGTKKLSVAYSATLEQVVPDELFSTPGFAPWRGLVGRGFTFADLIALGMARSSMEGNAAAAKEIREVTEGKVPDKLDATVQNNGTPILQVEFVSPKKEE